MTLEVRDFGTIEKTMVIRFWVDGHVSSAMVSMEKFAAAIDEMRAGMMSEDWDEALLQLLTGKEN
jgi:hypothetical protein